MNRRDIFKAIGLAGSGSVALANYPHEQPVNLPPLLPDSNVEQAVVWIPPTLCGCKLRITARWVDDVSGGISYRHPIPGSIQRVQLMNVCPRHGNAKIEPVDPWGGGRPGYMTIPANPSRSERLYIELARYSGMTHTIPLCGCQAHVCWDTAQSQEEREHVYLDHPVHTRHCARHQHDGPDILAARRDYSAHLAAQEIEA